MLNTFTEKANFIWSIADLIRDTFKRGRYQEIILPFTVLRRIDQVLEPTKDAVLATYAQYKDKFDSPPHKMLCDASGYAFYNTSPYTFARLLADPANLAHNLRAYIAGFSANMREVVEKFDFDSTVSRLNDAGLLYMVMERFNTLDLHPDRVSNEEMSYIFEELIRKFNEALNENPGEHFTPREVIRLMVRLLLAPDSARLHAPGLVVTASDPCCGTGGMVITLKEMILAANPDAQVYLFGQEVNPETYAICKSDLYMKSADGRDAENIAFGSTLSADQHAGQRFDYQLANPPYGKDWKMDRAAVEREAARGYAGRFGAGTPRISDGQLLFLQHMISRMREVFTPPLAPPRNQGGEHSPPLKSREGPGVGVGAVGSRIAIIMNGSPLFTGDAGSGESEIRRWILENDWLEVIIALPEQLFYNTGIATYIWVLSNHKAPRRQGLVQLIDATDLWQPMRKSLGNKRREITDEHIEAIIQVYEDFEESARSKIFKTTDFGYRKITVERPTRMNFCACEERILRLEDQRAFEKLAKNRKRKPKARAQAIAAGKEKQAAILTMLREMDPIVYKDVHKFRTALKKAAKAHGLKLYAAMRDAIVDALGEPDESAEVMVDRQGRPVPNTDLRDTERVPLDEDVHDYVAREVLPHVPDAWVDEDTVDPQDGDVGKVGYEINFNRYFYKYTPPRPLDEITADLRTLETEIVTLLAEVTLSE